MYRSTTFLSKKKKKRAHKELPDKVMEGLVTMDTTSTRMYSPHAIAALTPLVPSHDAGLPPNSISPADGLDAKLPPMVTHDANVDEAEAGLHAPRVVNKEDKVSVTRSPEDESERAEELSLNPSKAVAEQPEDGPSPPLVRKQGELLVEAANTERSDECPTRHEGPTLLAPANARPPDMMELRRPSQEAVSSEELSVLLHPPESAAAHTQHTPALDAFPVHSPSRSSSEREIRLRWKPPDCEKESKWHACYAVNNRLQPSAMEHLPPPGTAFRLSISRSPLAYMAQANSPRLLNVKVIWQARCKPPDVLDAIQQCSTTVISAKSDTSVKRSPSPGTTLALPKLLLASSAQAINPCHLNNELAYRVRKPPDATGHWLLDEAINKTDVRGRQGRLPGSWAASTRFPVAASLLALSAQTTGPCHWKNELAWRVRELPGAMERWLLDEAVNKMEGGLRRGHLPESRPTFTPSPACQSAHPLPLLRDDCPPHLPWFPRGIRHPTPTERTGFEPPVQVLQIMCYKKNTCQVN